ncbi:relaxase MobL [Oscillibacter sp.]|uniref:relaxase MobL n=1 Tax=Oscillibacter sp. TaxID=1945593 RepID=UPI00339462FF
MSDKVPELFVFKQSYKSRNRPSTRILNQKHLVYISTRPGVMRNPECGFGLWGKLPDMKASKNIDDLRTAYRAIGEASEGHTVYRAILSVDKNTARDYDLYDRETWQKLINTRISVIQREMHIKPENFRWVASMHYKKIHPHVHILYWDNGKEPRQEYICKERFEQISERVRTTFSRAVYFEKELKTVQEEQTETVKAVRLQLSAMLKSANLPDALNLDHVKAEELDELGKGLVELARTLPSTGRLKYGLLKSEYRQKLDEWLGQVMKISDFSKLEQKYLKLSADVTQLYGNDGVKAEQFLKQAHERLFTELGNETLSYLKKVALELQSREPPSDIKGLSIATWRIASQLLRCDPVFAELLKSLPKWRTPDSAILKEETIKNQVDRLTRALVSDLRVRSKAAGYMTATKTKELRMEANSSLYRVARAAVMEAIGKSMGDVHTIAPGDPPGDLQELSATSKRMAGQLLEDSPAFAALLTALPKQHQPIGKLMQNSAIKEQINSVIQELTHDLRIRSKIDRFTAETADSKEAAQEEKSAAYKDLYRSMNKLVLETTRQEMGYNVQEQREMATMALLRLFRSGSQSKNQLQSQHDLQREKYRNLSETAKRDLQKKRQQEGSWSMEF